MDQEQHSPQTGEQREFSPTVIRNRDIPLLAEILYIMQEIRLIEEQRDWQHDRLTHITQHLTGMPGGGGQVHGYEDAFAKLSELDEQHEDQCKAYAAELKTAQGILNGIRSRAMRVFVLMKYVFDVTDTEIREELNMTRRGFEKAKRAVEDAPDMKHVKWQDKYVVLKG